MKGTLTEKQQCQRLEKKQTYILQELNVSRIRQLKKIKKIPISLIL
ncbi:hypothetical protein [Klebsiella pneumoniae]|nr:hypothetical protein [Klebsiella pneumoniae]